MIQNREILGRLMDLDQKTLTNTPTDDVESLKMAAAACRQRFKADYALAVGAFPDPNLIEPKPVHLLLAQADGAIVKSVPYAGHPATLRIYIAKHALNMLRLAILDSSAR